MITTTTTTSVLPDEPGLASHPQFSPYTCSGRQRLQIQVFMGWMPFLSQQRHSNAGNSNYY